MSILIVEDDEGVQEALAHVLREEGYEVEIAADGTQALQRLRSGPPPSLILLDLMMPQMDGIEFRSHQLADSRLASIPVIVVSARPDAKRAVATMGFADILPKPMSFEVLLHAVQNTAITVVTTDAVPGKPKSLREAWRALHSKG